MLLWEKRSRLTINYKRDKIYTRTTIYSNQFGLCGEGWATLQGSILQERKSTDVCGGNLFTGLQAIRFSTIGTIASGVKILLAFVDERLIIFHSTQHVVYGDRDRENSHTYAYIFIYKYTQTHTGVYIAAECSNFLFILYKKKKQTMLQTELNELQKVRW